MESKIANVAFQTISDTSHRGYLDFLRLKISSVLVSWCTGSSSATTLHSLRARGATTLAWLSPSRRELERKESFSSKSKSGDRLTRCSLHKFQGSCALVLTLISGDTHSIECGEELSNSSRKFEYCRTSTCCAVQHVARGEYHGEKLSRSESSRNFVQCGEAGKESKA